MIWQVISGAIAMGFAVAAVFFLRFWRDTRDRLFALFAVAFAVLAVGRIVYALYEEHDKLVEDRYWIRFIAFIFILLAILDKNRSSKPSV